MRVDALSYELPAELIAQRPSGDRGAARMLVVRSGVEHRQVAELVELVPEGALVVVNDTRVIPARLLGAKADTGGKVEIFLVRRTGEQREDEGSAYEMWRALGKSSKALRFTSDVTFGASPLRARLFGRGEDGLLEVGLTTSDGTPVSDAVRAAGHVPLPPYIKREDEASDLERYQTVFARVDGAVAAPTAGLHLTNAMLGRLAVRGCELATVTLHVGLGTFQPVTVDDLDRHPMHAEELEVSRTTAAAVTRAHAEGRPVVAIGTTVVRALESAATSRGVVEPMKGETRLLIQPGYAFKAIDVLLTNFHLPRSTLLALVCAFGGTERVLAAYAEAVRAAYRFYSYGDAMLLYPAAGASPTEGASG